MMNETTFHSDLAIPPGEYLEEVISALGMAKEELAKRMGRPASKLSPIFKGEKAITPDTALQLEKVVGVSADIWIGLESEYRLTLARQQQEQEQEQLKQEASLVTSFCYTELVKLGVIAKHTKPFEKVRELQKFFGVASLNSVMNVHRYQVAFRCGTAGKEPCSPQSTVAWLRLGELQAQGISCPPFEKERLQQSLSSLRAMTRKPPKDFQPSLKEILAKAGVALIFCPHFSGTKAHGATFWLGREKAVVMISIRGRWADVFWFSLMHELGHILLHDYRDVFIEDGCVSDFEREKAADQFAADLLIPPSQFQSLIEKGTVRVEEISSFAESSGIDAGIVVGRLQHEGYLRHEWGNDLRTKYTWSKK